MGDYDELVPMSDAEIDEYLGGETSASKLLGDALKEATPAQKVRARALLLQAYERWLSTTVELSIVGRAIEMFDRGEYSHPAINRYLAEKAGEIFTGNSAESVRVGVIVSLTAPSNTASSPSRACAPLTERKQHLLPPAKGVKGKRSRTPKH